jgi:large subunit ribosomal protein L23
MNTYKVIKKPLITEKGAIAQQESNQYFFAVDTRATKHDICDAVEGIFKVKVEKIRTMRVRGKYRRVGKSMGRTSAWKKAIVTLGEGQRIEFLEGA